MTITHITPREQELMNRVAELEKDAARYRWLRKTTNWVSSGDKRIDVRNKPELWDAAIDDAMGVK